MSRPMTYVVSGMTCGHCVSSVRAEVGELDGVTFVEVDLASGRLDVTAEQLPDTASVRAAVQEAGYELTGEGATP